MNTTPAVFESHRPRLFAIAYRMLGARSEAEDLLQDAYLRWHESQPANIHCAVAFLVTITTRLCLDRLRKRRQELLDGSPAEAFVSHAVASPEARCECSEELSLALSVVLERLGREESAAFLLREVFDYDYPELARLLGKTAPACRQIVHRARKRVRQPNPSSAAHSESREPLLDKLLVAIRSGDRHGVLALMGLVTTDTSGGMRYIEGTHAPETI